jgi:DNA uptake protein ComE-like DNA-binding protein
LKKLGLPLKAVIKHVQTSLNKTAESEETLHINKTSTDKFKKYLNGIEKKYKGSYCEVYLNKRSKK